MIKDYYENIKMILERYPETRDDDMKLYARFCYIFADIGPSMKFLEVMFNHNKYELPSYESVTRIRRKVQEQERWLQGNRHKRRKELEQEYRDYYSPS